MMRLFETFQPAIGSPRERQVLDGLYGQMPVRNFSFDLLEQVPLKVAALEVNNVKWRDWGRAERIVESLSQIEKAPVFPTELMGVA